MRTLTGSGGSLLAQGAARLFRGEQPESLQLDPTYPRRCRNLVSPAACGDDVGKPKVLVGELPDLGRRVGGSARSAQVRRDRDPARPPGSVRMLASMNLDKLSLARSIVSTPVGGTDLGTAAAGPRNRRRQSSPV